MTLCQPRNIYFGTELIVNSALNLCVSINFTLNFYFGNTPIDNCDLHSRISSSLLRMENANTNTTAGLTIVALFSCNLKGFAKG